MNLHAAIMIEGLRRAAQHARFAFATLRGNAAQADYRVIEYPGAVHAFTNPDATALGRKFNLPLGYDAKVTSEAEATAAKFFAAIFRQ